MRRIAVLVSVLALALGVYSAGPAEGAAKQYSVVVGTIGGTMTRLGTGMVEIFNRHSPDARLTIIPGGGRANPERVGTGGGDFGFSFSTYLHQAYSGQPPYKRAFPELRGVIKLWTSGYHQYVGKEIFEGGIRSWADIVKSKRPLRLGTQLRGTSSEEFSRTIASYYKVSYDDLRKRGFTLTFTGVEASSQAYQAKQLDIFFHNGGWPTAAGMQAAFARATTFLEMPKDLAEHLGKLGMIPVTIPANTYKGQTQPVHTMGESGILFTTAKMDPGLVYSLLKVMFENKKFLEGVHRIYKEMDPQTSSQHISIPFHEGAKRFYAERGVRLP